MGKLNFDKVIRAQIKEIGFDNSNTDMDYRTCKINIDIKRQSLDISLGVNDGGYARHGGGAFSGKDATKVDRSASYMLKQLIMVILVKKSYLGRK